MKFYALKDNLVNRFVDYIYAVNDDDLKRVLLDALSNPKSSIARHYKDFSIYSVCELNESTFVVSSFETPVKVLDIQDLVAQKADEVTQ